MKKKGFPFPLFTCLRRPQSAIQSVVKTVKADFKNQITVLHTIASLYISTSEFVVDQHDVNGGGAKRIETKSAAEETDLFLHILLSLMAIRQNRESSKSAIQLKKNKEIVIVKNSRVPRVGQHMYCYK